MPVTATGAGAAGVGVAVGAGVVGGGVTVVGVTVVGVAVGVFMQVQVGVGVGGGVVGGVVYEVDDAGVGWSPPLGDVAARAECETNRTVKLVTASAVLANPAIFARFVIFKAVTRCLLGCDKNRARGQ